MLLEDFNHTIDAWINSLEKYDLDLLCIKPSPGSWSLGQVYVHLIDDTNYYLEQIRACVSTNDNASEEASQDAKTMLLNNDFPDVVIEGSPGNAYIPQPESKEQLLGCLLKLKSDFHAVNIVIAKSACNGKTKHPALGYFNATEWFRFAEMHFRHHIRQKKRIDEFLNTGL